MSVSARAGRRRQEGAEKVRGATRFTADLELAGLLHVRLVLAHGASARIGRIETSAAKAAPGVVDVVTGADLPELEVARPELPLAVDRVFFAGQPVVAVVAESEAAAIDAASLVEVDLEETAPVVDAAVAMRDQSPLVLEEDETASEEDASIHGASASAEETPEDRPRNVTGVTHLRRGDAAKAMKDADVVVAGAYSIGGAHHSFLEPHVSVVRPEPDGSLTIWSPTQGPFVVRDEVSQLAGLPPHKVRVVPMPVGGGFGGKVLLLEPLLALLALRVRRPVRLALDRSHEFVFGRPAPAARFEVELGAKRDGTLVALSATPVPMAGPGRGSPRSRSWRRHGATPSTRRRSARARRWAWRSAPGAARVRRRPRAAASTPTARSPSRSARPTSAAPRRGSRSWRRRRSASLPTRCASRSPTPRPRRSAPPRAAARSRTASAAP